MTIDLKYYLNERIWVIENSKATSIIVNCVSIKDSGVYYGENIYTLYPESQCFPTKEALLTYVADK